MTTLNIQGFSTSFVSMSSLRHCVQHARAMRKAERDVQIGLCDIEEALPCVKAFFHEGLMVLLKSQLDQFVSVVTHGQ